MEPRTLSADPRLTEPREIRRRQFGPVVVWTGVVLSLVSWRVGAYYEGGVDAVVAAKGLLSLVVLAIAASLYSTSLDRRPIGWFSPTVVVLYLLATLMGALASGNLLPSAVLTVRVAIIFTTVALLVACYRPPTLVSTLATSMLVVAAIAAATGAPSYVETGRLVGGVLPINPNEIAVLVGFPALVSTWRILASRATIGDTGVVLACVAVTWLTGSRTGLLALAVAFVIMTLLARRVPALVSLLVLASVPTMLALANFTTVISSYVSRGNVDTVYTLSNRTVAWSAAFAAPTDFWERWFGAGLSVKTVAVTAAYGNAQVIDNSWVSALVKGGVIAVLVMGIWLISTALNVARLDRSARSFWVPILAYLAITSMTNSGLIDADLLFLTITLVALSTDPVTRLSPRTVQATPGVSRPQNGTG